MFPKAQLLVEEQSRPVQDACGYSQILIAVAVENEEEEGCRETLAEVIRANHE